MAEWLKATDCKFVDKCLRRFESYFFQKYNKTVISRKISLEEDTHSASIKSKVLYLPGGVVHDLFYKQFN